MSITYSSLAAEVVGYLQISASDTDKYQVQNSLNRAQLHLLNTLPARLIANAIKSNTDDIDTGVALYEFPEDYLRFISLRIDYENSISDDNPGRPVQIVEKATDLVDASNIDRLPSTLFPKATIDADGGFEIRPVPEANVIDGYRLDYVYQPPEISADQDCTLWPGLRNLLVYYAASLSASVEGNSLGLRDTFLEYFREELKSLVPA